jgi:hypothetical protein
MMRHLLLVSASGTWANKKSRPHRTAKVVRLGFCFPEFLRAHPSKYLLRRSHLGYPFPGWQIPEGIIPDAILYVRRERLKKQSK